MKSKEQDIMLDIFVESPVNIYDVFVGKLIADLGMTGSGKSNTAARIIEQLLKNKIGMTLLDIEGEYSFSPNEESIWESNLKNWVRDKFGHYENEEYFPIDAIQQHFQNWIIEKARVV